MNRRSMWAAVWVAGGVFLVAVSFLAVMVLVAVGGALPGGGCGGDGGLGGGAQQLGTRNWSGEQTANAATITAAAAAAGLPERAAVLGVATAIVESGLRNLTYGDRDSLGLFQQRPSAGWGAAATILNAAASAATFFAHLVAVPNWPLLAPGAAEQTVQGSAFPARYAPQEAPAAALVARYWTGTPTPVPAPAPAGTPPPAAGVGTAGAATAGAGTAGAFTPGCADQGGSNLPLGPSTVDPTKLPAGFVLPADAKQAAAIGYALAQVGKPYVWGAEGPNSFDCSGLMQAAYAAAGVAISRTTSTQVSDGAPVAGLAAVSPGDLLLIPGADGTPTHPGHVGMYAGNGVIVDAYDTQKGVILETVAAWRNQVVAIRHITGATSSASAPTAGAAA